MVKQKENGGWWFTFTHRFSSDTVLEVFEVEEYGYFIKFEIRHGGSNMATKN